MINTKVIFRPKQLYLASEENLTIKLIFKRIITSTNHEVEKIQSKSLFSLKNNKALLDCMIQFKLCKQFEIKNTKIVIIIMSIKGRQISFLGNAVADLSLLYTCNTNLQTKIKIQKCLDPKAIIITSIQFQEITNETSIKLQNQPFTTQKQPQSYIKKKGDIPTADDIILRNYKHREYVRCSNYKQIDTSKQSKEKSYHKRFQLSKTKNNQNLNKTAFQNTPKISPKPRIITPQPFSLYSQNQANHENVNNHKCQIKIISKPNYTQISNKLELIEDKINSRITSELKPQYINDSNIKLSQFRKKFKPSSQNSPSQRSQNSYYNNELLIKNIQTLESDKQALIQKIKQLTLQGYQNKNIIQELKDKYQRQSKMKLNVIIQLEAKIATFEEENKKLMIKLDTQNQKLGNSNILKQLQQKVKQLAKQNQKLKEKLNQYQQHQLEKMFPSYIESQKQKSLQKEADKKKQFSQQKIKNNHDKKIFDANIVLNQEGNIQNQKIREVIQQNQNLKRETKLLQKKLQELNNFIKNSKIKQQNVRTSSQKLERIKILQQKIDNYQKQLKQSKLKMATIVNILWTKGSSELVNEISKLVAIQ